MIGLAPLAVILFGLAMMASAPVGRLCHRRPDAVATVAALVVVPFVVDTPDDFDALERGKLELLKTYREAGDL